MATTQTPSSLEQQSKSLPKFPLFGVWSEEGWLIDSSIPVADGSILWTKYMKDQNMNANQALIVIISKFFRNY
jgi:hypothetical protein